MRRRRSISEPIVIRPGRGEVIGDSPERRVEILSDDDALHATWSRFGPRRDGADLHVHRRHTDLFYVLEGELTVRLGAAGERAAVPAGTLVQIPPLVVHGFRNETDAELRYLNLHAPGQGFATYMRALRDGRALAYDQEPPPPDGGRPTTDARLGGTDLEVEAPGLRMVLLADREEIAIAEAWSDGRGASSSPHVHHRHVESFYVLEGEMALGVADRELRAEAGSWVQLPPGVPHTSPFAASERARFLDVHSPGCGFGGFLHAGGDERAGARDRFDQEPAG